MGPKEGKKRRRAAKEQELGTEASRCASTAWLLEMSRGGGSLGSVGFKREDLVC